MNLVKEGGFDIKYSVANYSGISNVPYNTDWDGTDYKIRDPGMAKVSIGKKADLLDFYLRQFNGEQSRGYTRIGRWLRRVEFSSSLMPGSVEVPTFDYLTLLDSSGFRLEDVINPKADAEYLFRSLQEDGKPILARSDSDYQIKGMDLTKRACGLILDRYGDNLSPDQACKLERLPEGVVVVDSLNPLIKDITEAIDLSPTTRMILKALKKPPISRILKANIKFEVEGGTNKDLNSLILLKGIVDGNKEKGLHTTTHEILHVISDGTLPQMLNEAATDLYAEAAIGESVGSEHRMTGGFRDAVEMWVNISRILGEQVTLEAYLEPSVVKKVIDPDSKKVVSSRLMGPTIHEIMYAELGEDKSGRSNWEKLLQLMEDKRISSSFDVLVPRSRLQKTRDGLRDAYLELAPAAQDFVIRDQFYMLIQGFLR